MRTGSRGRSRGLFEGERLVGVRTAAGEELRAAAPSCSPPAPGRRRPSGCPSTPARRCARSRARSSSCAAATATAPCERIVASERVYLVPRPDGRLIVGATSEEQGFDTAVTAGGVHELLREAYRLLPDVAEMELVDSMAGLRPGTPDNLPLIGPGAIEGLVLATGHYRNGILLAPLTADAIAALLAGEQLPEAAAPAHPARLSFVAQRATKDNGARRNAPGLGAEPCGPRRRTCRARSGAGRGRRSGGARREEPR